jgi:hypothetical protein
LNKSFGKPEEDTMAEQLAQAPVAHIRFDGRSLDVALGDLDIGPETPDAKIKVALARHLEVPAAKLRDYVIDRHETGNLTVRPAAVFG